jgi:hypothetical protein
MRYPPDGIRGMAATRASGWGRNANYAKEANREVCLLVQVETREGMRNLDAIAAVEGVDGVFIGRPTCPPPSATSATPGTRDAGDDRRRFPPHPGRRQGGRHPDAGRDAGAQARRDGRHLHRGGTDSNLMVKATSGLGRQFKGAAAAQQPPSRRTTEAARMNAVPAARAPDMHPDEWSARVQLAAAYRIFDMLGWTEMIYNHITVRLPDSVTAGTSSS